MQVIFKKVKSLWIFCLAQIICLFRYERRFCTSRYFRGKEGKKPRIGAQGWRWIVADYKGCRLLKKNLDVPFPVSPYVTVVGAKNITFHPDDLHIFHTYGTYFQAIGKITIGHGTYIAPMSDLLHQITLLEIWNNMIRQRISFLERNVGSA